MTFWKRKTMEAVNISGCQGLRGREGGRYGESSIGTYALPYVKWIASGNLLYDAASSNLVLCDSLEG